MKTVLVTGGAGFIGSNFVQQLVAENNDIRIINLDKLTYAGNLESLQSVWATSKHIFVKGGIEDSALVADILSRYEPAWVVNFAAESHVDRSIAGPEQFIQTNIVGTFQLLEAVKTYWESLSAEKQKTFRFLHVSTDEVYGTLGDKGLFSENTPYAPNSPYSASKASSDHLVRAYHHTYGLPTLTTNCSNNYGPCQFPEKLIPLMIINALGNKSLPIYGDGSNVRDWLYVEDHCRAIWQILHQGAIGETYNIGGHNEKTNLEIVYIVCDLLDELSPRLDGKSYHKQIIFVEDRLGHDLRYAIDASKLCANLGWEPKETFESGIRKTVVWYLNNRKWCEHIMDGSYRQRNEIGMF